MINEQENKTSLTKLSPEEYEKNQTEMSRYRVNGLTYRLALLAMFTGLFATLVLLNSMTPNIHSFIIVMLIIVILLGGFLAAEKAKSYSLKGSIALGVFGGVTLIEFIYPVILMINFTKFINNYKGADDAAVAKTKEAVKYVGPSITESYYKHNLAFAYLNNNGIFRGIFIIVLLGISAASFIVACVFGIKRSQRLTRYLDSIKQD